MALDSGSLPVKVPVQTRLGPSPDPAAAGPGRGKWPGQCFTRHCPARPGILSCGACVYRRVRTCCSRPRQRS